MKKNINSSINLILSIINLKIVVKKLLGQINLFRTYVFYFHKLIYIIIIHKYKDLIFIFF